LTPLVERAHSRAVSAIRRVRSADGVRVAVYEHGDPASSTVVLIHGYPDNAGVWNAVVAELGRRYHVVSYDVRGAGKSDKPSERAAYRIERLVDDFTAVINATSPDHAVHVLAHDWGSVQGWACVLSGSLQSRIASFTSISGPDLEQTGRWVRSNLRPSSRALGKVVRQLGDSYYVALFQVPMLPELAWRSGAVDLLLRLAERRGTENGTDSGTDSDPGSRTDDGYRRSWADKLNGLQLYRANLLRAASARLRTTDIPVQVLAPTADPFVSTALQLEAPQPFVRNLTLRSVAGDHWIIRTRPEVVAAAVTELVDRVGAGALKPAD
jgi:pimeloyl-ACP methyl ester carboxylesterase